jgi:hypothetical protein
MGAGFAIVPNFTSPYQTIGTDLLQAPFVFTGTAGYLYFFRFRTHRIVGGHKLYSPWSTFSKGCNVVAQVGVPLSITVPPSSTTGVFTVAWEPAPGALWFELEEDSSPTFSNPVTIYSGPLWSVSLTRTTNGSYSYRVRGLNPLSQGPYLAGANPCSVNVQPVGTSTYFFVPSGSLDGTYALCWGPAQNASLYELEEDTNRNFTNPTLVYRGPNRTWRIYWGPQQRQNGTYYYRVRGVNTLYQGAYRSGANPCVVTLQGILNMYPGQFNAPRTVFPGSLNTPVFQFLLRPDFVETMKVQTIEFTERGTVDLARACIAATLAEDVNNDGLLDPGDRIIASIPPGAGNTLRFAGLNEIIPPRTSRVFLLTYDLSPSTPMGTTIQGSIRANEDIQVLGAQYGSTRVHRAPISGALKCIGGIGSITLTCPPQSLADIPVPPGSLGVPVLSLRLFSGSTETVAIHTLVLTGEGTLDESRHIDAVTLHHDRDDDGLFDPQKDTAIAGPMPFTADNGTIRFSFSHPLEPRTCTSLIVVVDFGSTLPRGSTFRAWIRSEGDVLGTEQQSHRDVFAIGAPVWGDRFIGDASPSPPSPSSGGCGRGVDRSGIGAQISWAFLLLAFGLGWRFGKKGKGKGEMNG